MVTSISSLTNALNVTPVNGSSTTAAANQSTTNAAVDTSQLVINVLNYVDLTVRVVATLIFVLYFGLIAWKRELRKASLFYVHHANFVSLIYVLIYLSFFNSKAPSLGSAYMNDVFCHVVEVLFGLLKFLRSYSVLLIAVYRFNSAYFIHFHREMNKKNIYVFLPVLGIWLLSMSLAMAAKYAFRTTYGSSLCTDGYSDNFGDLVNYLIATSVISISVPFIFTLVIYYLIKVKLGKNSPGSRKTSETQSKQQQQQQSKEQRFTTQLIAINLCYITSFTIAFVQTFRYIIPGFNTNYYYLRQGLRILNLTSISLLPILSTYFNPMLSLRSLRSSLIESVTRKPSTRTNIAVSQHSKSIN